MSRSRKIITYVRNADGQYGHPDFEGIKKGTETKVDNLFIFDHPEFNLLNLFHF